MTDITRNYHGGNEESRDAYLSIAGSITEAQRRQVVSYITEQGTHGGTSDEVEVALGLPHQSVSARLTELKRDGLLVAKVVDEQKVRRPTRSGRGAQVLISKMFDD